MNKNELSNDTIQDAEIIEDNTTGKDKKLKDGFNEARDKAHDEDFDDKYDDYDDDLDDDFDEDGAEATISNDDLARYMSKLIFKSSDAGSKTIFEWAPTPAIHSIMLREFIYMKAYFATRMIFEIRPEEEDADYVLAKIRERLDEFFHNDIFKIDCSMETLEKRLKEYDEAVLEETGSGASIDQEAPAIRSVYMHGVGIPCGRIKLTHAMLDKLIMDTESNIHGDLVRKTAAPTKGANIVLPLLIAIALILIVWMN